MYLYIFTHTHIYSHLYIYIYIYLHTHTYVYIYIVRIQVGREEVKLSLSTDHMILYVENSMALPKKNLRELIDEFSKVMGYKVNIQKQLCFWQQESLKTKKTVSFKIASK